MVTLKHEEMTRKVIGCAMTVHRALGNGFQEVIYQRALGIEMRKVGLNFVRELEVLVHYNGMEVGTRRADFIVEGIVLVELKALTRLEDVHMAQAINYLKAYELGVCLLINFGSKSLEFKRYVHSPIV